MTATLSFLFEHASGYGILSTHMHELDEILGNLKIISVDYETFSKTFELNYSPFKSAQIAIDNCFQISEGLAHKCLRRFLKKTLNDGKPYILYVSEYKLGDDLKSFVNATLPNVTISTESGTLEVFRQIRRYFPQYIESLSAFAETKAHIGLGHNYSRYKVLYNVNREDNLVMHTISLLDQMDKDINSFSMRIKEWFSYHFPELAKIVPECSNFIKIASIIRSRENIGEDALEKIEEIVGDHEKAEAIVAAAKSSMGLDITEQDIENLAYLTEGIKTFSERRAATYAYLTDKLSIVAPNLNALVGSQVAARLMTQAGSLTKLAKCPASTIQILGAEKALFRALRTRGRTPKYGLLFHSSFIGKASAENKGRISRFLAAKCAIASRIDCFSDEPCDVFGSAFKKQVEERLKYFETGTLPKTNAEAMKEALKEAEMVMVKKRAEDQEMARLNGDSQPEKKKRKKQKSVVIAEETPQVEEDQTTVKEEEILSKTEKKKAKKRRHEEMVADEVTIKAKEVIIEEEEAPKKKKTKNKHYEEEESGDQVAIDTTTAAAELVLVEEGEKKKNKHKQTEEVDT
ncbi:hypothetical protein ACTXT7_006346 [Hymenolepis weldensis]